ncbi:MAG: hypothetical protein K0Q99_1117 [Clostridia bacterium]|jgi:hypothetical protein|nr:hypothetical protein [Clostridia bacterium]
MKYYMIDNNIILLYIFINKSENMNKGNDGKSKLIELFQRAGWILNPW